MYALETYPRNVSTTSGSLRNWAPDKPYNDLPRLPPRLECETHAVLKACIEARAAVEGLKQAGELVPNQAVLINTIPLLEAQASSEIENIVTTADALFQHPDPADHTADPATKEAQRYRGALFEGFKSLSSRPLCTRTAIDVCSTIKLITAEVRRVPGTKLEDHVGRVIYTPPEGEALLQSLLSNWEAFMHDEKIALDPLVRMAIGHYQFEAIHPFGDGNGRTGRILNILYLVEKGLLTLPVLYLSRYVIAHKADYYGLLLEVTREEAWEKWILFMLAATADTARWTTAKILAIRKLHDAAVQYVRHHEPKIYSRELIDVIFEKPYARISDVTERGLAARQTASRYLAALEGIGVLKSLTLGREKLFVHPKLMALLKNDSNEITPYAKTD